MYYCPVIRKGNREKERKKCISNASFFKKKRIYVVKSEQTKQDAASCLLQKKNKNKERIERLCVPML